MNETVKLQQFLAHSGIASRRKAEVFISEGKVKVNGEVAHIGQRIDPKVDRIEFEGKPLFTEGKLVYYKLHKPQGYVSTVSDELERKTVLDLLPNSQERIYPVGRLDLESEGLILLTNDGTLTQILTHPKFEIEKTYEVLLQGIPSTLALNHLKRGVKLKEGFTKPVKMKILSRENQRNTWIEMTIKEGRYQQVRRMIRRIGYEVLRLKRVQFGPIVLDTLPSGEYSPLTEQEVAELMQLKQSESYFL